MGRLRRDNAVVCIIDVQERLLTVIDRSDELVASLKKLTAGTRILGIPIVITEQYVKGLGATVESLRDALADSYQPIEKACFSSYGCESFRLALERLGRKQVLLAGIEAHVCVYQTAIDLLSNGYEVHLLEDAVNSRTSENREIAIRRLMQEGAKLTSVEMALFELTVTSGTDEFRAISKIVK